MYAILRAIHRHCAFVVAGGGKSPPTIDVDDDDDDDDDLYIFIVCTKLNMCSNYSYILPYNVMYNKIK